MVSDAGRRLAAVTVDQLIARLLKIESLHAGATTEGEKVASDEARRRIIEHLARLDEEPIEMRFTLYGRWSQQLFVALARRYGIEGAVHRDLSEAKERAEPRQLAMPMS